MAKAVFHVRNWDKFQHYRDRTPPWIKLATDTFQNYEFSCLHDASKLLALCIWTLAARSMDGSVPADFEWIKRQGNLSDFVGIDNLKELIDSGFLLDASSVLASCYPSRARGEAETEAEGETEAELPKPREGCGEISKNSQAEKQPKGDNDGTDRAITDDAELPTPAKGTGAAKPKRPKASRPRLDEHLGRSEESLCQRTGIPLGWAEWAANELGWDQQRIEWEWKGFAEYWLSANAVDGGRKADWRQTYRGSMRRSHERNPTRRVPSGSHGHGGQPDKITSILRHCVAESLQRNGLAGGERAGTDRGGFGPDARGDVIDVPVMAGSQEGAAGVGSNQRGSGQDAISLRLRGDASQRGAGEAESGGVYGSPGGLSDLGCGTGRIVVAEESQGGPNAEGMGGQGGLGDGQVRPSDAGRGEDDHGARSQARDGLGQG